MTEKKYYQQTVEETFREQETEASGLTSQAAADRLKQTGPNALAEGKKKPVFLVFLEQFKDLLVVILLLAAGISFASGQKESTIVITAVLILNAVLGTVQHVKAEKSLESLKAMSSPTAKVRRDGQVVEIPSAEVVPGDIISLETGDLIVADGRLCENFSLKVNESSLTGESESVEKTTEALGDQEVSLGDQKNMVFSGSLVTYGRGTMVVTGTGMSTEIGKIASLMNQTEQRKTPLQVSMDQFSRKLAVAVLAICALVFALSVYRKMPTLDAMMFAVALAVAAIPEALSSIVTIVLAMGTQKMAKQNAIMKELKAVESLGAVSVICSDKTGTLTQNRMTVQEVYTAGAVLPGTKMDLQNPVHQELLTAAVLDNDATENDGTGVGDPTEIALVVLGEKLGVEETIYRNDYPRSGELAFDSERKLMSTLHVMDQTPVMFTKGAVDEMLERTVSLLTPEGEKPITEEEKQEILRVNQEFSEQGLRVLAFAKKDLDQSRELVFEDESGLTFLGLISMIDPPREEAIQAVADAKKGGIRTVMITGDHKVTAAAIAKKIGIFQEGDICLNGRELDAISDEELDQKLSQISVYARVSPEHKIRIVSAWQRRGAIVSMTGDGVNDAPALKAADIGVAMGITGTEVSKDAADMILADDNFATIVKAVVNGRNVYGNILNAINFLLSGNMAGILCVLFASLAGLPVPFAAVHLLFINLLTDSLPAIAIGMEPARADLLNQKPRNPKEGILNKALAMKIFGQGALIAAATMGAFFIGLSRGGAGLASTMAFATLTLSRLFHGFNCRGKASIFRLGLGSNPYSLGAFGLGVLLLAAVLFVPGVKSLFLVQNLSLGLIGWIALLAVAPTVVIQGVKLAQGKQ